MRKSILAAISKFDKMELTWDSFVKVPDSEGDGATLILKLSDPIPYVRGSQDVELDGKMIPVDQHDVQEVKIHTSTIKSLEDKYNEKYDALVAAGKEQEAEKLEPEMYFDEDQTGGYSGENLILDVAARTREVWFKLPNDSFKNASTSYRNQRRLEQRRTVYGGAISSRKVTG